MLFLLDFPIIRDFSKNLFAIFTIFSKVVLAVPGSIRKFLILPEGVDEAMLKFILRRVSKDGTEFLFLYFCGNGNDRLTSDGFSVGGEKIMRIIIEETCKAQITVFDACTALVPIDDDSDYEVNDDCKDDIEAARNDANRDFCRKDTGGKNSVFEK